MRFVQDQFGVRERKRGVVGTTANTDTLVYTVPIGSAPVLIESVLLNCAGGTTRTVDVAVVTSTETYADGTYDIASALSVAAGTPVNSSTYGPFYMFEGDSLHLLASGAGIRYVVHIGKERTNNANVSGV